MTERRVKTSNLAAALDVRPETVYGWLAGQQPENMKAVKTALIAVYGHSDGPTAGGSRIRGVRLLIRARRGNVIEVDFLSGKPFR